MRERPKKALFWRVRLTTNIIAGMDKLEGVKNFVDPLKGNLYSAHTFFEGAMYV
jgi:hypothetical protein